MNEFTNAETAAQLARWTPAHSLAAVRHGWDMFDYNSMGLLEIERCDETGKFKTDQGAIDFVKLRAKDGDPTAILALELDDYFQPIIDRVRDTNATLNARPR